MKITSLRSKDVIKVLKKLGYVKVRQTGSHRIFYHSVKKKIVPVPMHNKDLKRGLVRAIIRELEISKDEFIKLLK